MWNAAWLVTGAFDQEVWPLPTLINGDWQLSRLISQPRPPSGPQQCKGDRDSALPLLIAFFREDSILLAQSKARKIERDDHHHLYSTVDEMKIASGAIPNEEAESSQKHT